MRLSVFVAAALLAFGLPTAQVPPPPPPPPAQVQTLPPRDPGRRLPPEPVGTAIIRGRVVAGDTGSPVRKANVSLSAVMPLAAMSQSGLTGAGGRSTQPATQTVTQTVMINGNPVQVTSALQAGMLRPKTAVTDSQGLFEFKDLPAGTYRLSANPGQYSAQYLGTTYGAKRANAPGSIDQGQPIPLTDGQTFTATIALMKGAVITGRVSDENGDALARVQVYTMFFPAGSTRGQRYGSTVSTDDLGNFRLYGLAPGEYAVVAEARGNTFTPPNAPPETEEERIGILTTYYPGTPDEASAQRVRTRSGAETSGIEIRMVSGRMLHISGMVVDSQGKTDTRFNVMLMRGTGSGFNSFGINMDPTGHFQARNIPPGEYKLVARQMINRPPNADPRTPPDPGEFAVVPLSLTTDMDDLLVTAGPGATITGQIVYENGAPPLLPNGQQPPPPRVNAQTADQNFGGVPGPQSVQVSPDLTFTMKGFMGEYLLRANGGGAYMKSVQIGGEDITDTPHEFKQGDRVTIVMTSKASTIEGAVTNDRGEPVNSGTVLLFSESKTSWRVNSIHMRRGGPDITGHFRLMGVLPGRYFLIALPQERANALNYGNVVDPAIFEQFAKEATSVTVGEDEQRQVDLKIAPGSGG